MSTFRIRSYVPRGRRTQAQERAYQELWPQVGLQIENGLLNYPQIFGRNAPCYLEIGFGSGQSLLALAAARSDCDFIGVETHQPGIGALCMGIQSAALSNIRIYYADVIDVLEKCIAPDSLHGIQIFFPDPWQKRRHHQRRLIQPAFIQHVTSRLQTNGILHLATDWQDYSCEMLQALSAAPQLINLAGAGQFSSERSSQRPIVTKFEMRALREGRNIWEMQCVKA